MRAHYIEALEEYFYDLNLHTKALLNALLDYIVNLKNKLIN